MVGPLTDDERDAGNRSIKVGFVALVGLSSGLIALQGAASMSEIAVVVAAGLAVGVVLLAVIGFGL